MSVLYSTMDQDWENRRLQYQQRLTEAAMDYYLHVGLPAALVPLDGTKPLVIVAVGRPRQVAKLVTDL